MKNLDWINNWDLIDITAPHIAGNWLLDKPRDILYELAKSGRLWDRRIAIIATFHFIRNGDFNDAIKICNILISDYSRFDSQSDRLDAERNRKTKRNSYWLIF
jgi:3-methyladenine DNA glycosylase AlkD